MNKYFYVAVLFCFHVVFFDTSLAQAIASPSQVSSKDLDILITASRGEAQAKIRAQIEENQRLAIEISQIQQDLESIKKDIGDNKSAAKTDLIIAGTTALAATILTIWLSRRTGRDEIAEYNLAFSAASIVVGAAITVTKGTQAGYHYLLVKLDQNKLPVLEQKLAALKAQLEKQTAELIK